MMQDKFSSGESRNTEGERRDDRQNGEGEERRRETDYWL